MSTLDIRKPVAIDRDPPSGLRVREPNAVDFPKRNVDKRVSPEQATE
jgi:hypothetical protein